PLDVDGQHHGLRPEVLGGAGQQFRVRHRSRVDGDLVGSGQGQGPDVVERPDAAPYRQGHEAALGDAGDDVEQSAPAVGRSGDVVEDQLIGALQVVAHGQLDRVADVMQFAEFGAAELLTARGAPVVDVKAGDDASREHAGQDSSTSATVVTRGRVVPAHALTAGRGARGSR